MSAASPRVPSSVLVRPLVAALVALFAFVAIFVEAFHQPQLHGLTIGVVGSPATAASIQRELDAQQPGALDVRDYTREQDAREDLEHADVHGVLIPGAGGDRALVAQASGVPPTQFVTASLQALAARHGSPLDVTDVAPLPSSDRLGFSEPWTVIGTLLPSLAFGALLAFAGARVRGFARWSAIAVYAVVAGLVVALDVDVLVGALTGAFLGVALVGGLLALAVTATTHGLTRAAGPLGAVTAVCVLIVLGLPSAGGAATSPLQPGFYSSISGLLPPGAALSALRNVVYFDWGNTAQPLLVLVAWSVGGLAIGLAGDRAAATARQTPAISPARAA